MFNARSQARAELRRDEQRRQVNAHKRRIQERRVDRRAFKGEMRRRVFGV